MSSSAKLTLIELRKMGELKNVERKKVDRKIEMQINVGYLVTKSNSVHAQRRPVLQVNVETGHRVCVHS